MKIGLHVVSFSWPGAPRSIAPTLAGIASEMARKLDVLRRHCDDESRDFDSIEKTMLSRADAFSEPDAFVAKMRTYADLGIDTVIFVPSGDPVEFTRRLGDVGARLQNI
jgi:hypothetical protein